MQLLSIARWSDVPDRQPVGAPVGNVDLFIVRFDDDLTTFDSDMRHLAGISCGGLGV